MKLKLLSLAIVCASMLFAEVKPGENLLINGNLEADQVEMPDYWTPHSDRFLTYNSTAGHKGKPALIFANNSGKPSGEISIRQYSLDLVPGEQYKISAWIKTKNFSSGHCGIVIYDNGWNKDVGLNKFPVNSDWTLLEKTFTLIPSANNVYNLALFAVNFKGELAISQIKLEAISEKALKNSSVSSAMYAQIRPRLIPMKPLLNWIPSNNPKLEFNFFGKLPHDKDGNNTSADEYEIQYTINDKLSNTLKFNENLNVIDLAKAPKGDSKLKVELINKNSKQAVFQENFTISIVDIPVVSAQGHKRLNNLVVEILNQNITSKAPVQNFQFAMTRLGWVYIAAKNVTAKGIKVVLNEKLTVIDDNTDRLETFREIPAGIHTLTIHGANNVGNITVRAIPDIFNYCPGINNLVQENPNYDFDFLRKYVLPAVTTLNGGNIPQDKRQWLQDNGYHWLANLGSTNLKDGEDLKNRLQRSSGFSAPFYDGVTCDEQFFGQPTIDLYTQGLKLFDNPTNKLIYTWIVGKPNFKGMHHDFMATSFNVSKGRGKLLYEAYCRTRETKELAAEFLDLYVTDTIRKFKKFYPGAEYSTGIIFGNFNQLPILSLAHHPEVDYKYYLDMQINLLANNPEFLNLGSTGYWGSYYADHELHRWSFMLMRHYCVEGETSMLSDKYGFSYNPGHIQNGDFRDSLAPWAAKGNIRTDSFQGFASASQNRWGGNNGVGDTFAVFTKKDAEFSTLSQTIKNLVPGKMYCLQFSTVDFNDVKAKKLNPRLFGIEAILGKDAQIDKDLSWTHIDKRVKGRYRSNDNVSRINLHHIVFKANAKEIPLMFSNAKSLKGEALGLNYVMLTPFLMP